MGEVGRPTKLTEKTTQMVCQALAAGNTRRASCQYAGISEDSLARYLQASADFAEAVRKAEADAEVRHVANIAKAANDGTWTASAWWLERRQPADWGRKDRIDLNLLKASNDDLVSLLTGGTEDVAEGTPAGSGDPEAAG